MNNGATNSSATNSSATNSSATNSSTKIDFAAKIKQMSSELDRYVKHVSQQPHTPISLNNLQQSVRQNITAETEKRNRFFKLHRSLIQSAKPGSPFYLWIEKYPKKDQLGDFSKKLQQLLTDSEVEEFAKVLNALPNNTEPANIFLNQHQNVTNLIWEHLELLEDVHEAFTTIPGKKKTSKIHLV